LIQILVTKFSLAIHKSVLRTSYDHPLVRATFLHV
jgi:hypothetical protein